MGNRAKSVGEMPRANGAQRPSLMEDVKSASTTQGRRKPAEAYLLNHICKTCNGKNCIGRCRF